MLITYHTVMTCELLKPFSESQAPALISSSGGNGTGVGCSSYLNGDGTAGTWKADYEFSRIVMAKKRKPFQGGNRRSQAEADEVDDLESRIQESQNAVEGNKDSGPTGKQHRWTVVLMWGQNGPTVVLTLAADLQEQESSGTLTTCQSQGTHWRVCVLPSTPVSQPSSGLPFPARWRGMMFLEQPRLALGRPWHS